MIHRFHFRFACKSFSYTDVTITLRVIAEKTSIETLYFKK